MVSISKNSVQPRRIKRGMKKSFLEKLQSEESTQVLSSILVVLVVILYFTWSSLTSTNAVSTIGTTSTAIKGATSTNVVGKRINAQDRVHLNFESSLGAAYESIAIDILQTLDCENFLKTTGKEYNFNLSPTERKKKEEELNKKVNAMDYGMDAEVEGNVRRRLAAADDDNDDPTVVRREAKEENELNAGDWNEGIEEGMKGTYDDYFGNARYIPEVTVTGKHLFCIAAVSDVKNLSAEMKQILANWKEELKCDATNNKQQTLLDLWSTARAEITDKKVLLETLEVSSENSYDLWNRTLYLWSPEGDLGISYMLEELNNEKPADRGGIHGLSHNLGHGHLFIDVGSSLGITTLAVALLYQGTRIVSIEPAAPNWLMQEMNLRCNLLPMNDQNYPTVLLSGIGPTKSSHMGHGSEMAAKFMWRPSATTATRAWTPKEEHTDDKDIELIVKLRSWRSLLAEADLFEEGYGRNPHIDVLNVDCEGCEYNLIPAISEEDFNSIDTIMGGFHWGFIPKSKLPSTERAQVTHKRMCAHEGIARVSKECCGFPDMPVISSSKGEMLVKNPDQFPMVPSTVSDVAGELCDGFDEWAKDNQLFDIENDFGWFQLTSMAG